MRLLPHVDAGVVALARRTGRDVSAVANEILEEGLRLRRIPGIYFRDTPSGRVAHVSGTGLGVFEIIRGYREMDSDWARLRVGFHWLSEAQLRAAFAYAEAYPDEIEARLAIEEAGTPERVWRTYPFMRPDPPDSA